MPQKGLIVDAPERIANRFHCREVTRLSYLRGKDDALRIVQEVRQSVPVKQFSGRHYRRAGIPQPPGDWIDLCDGGLGSVLFRTGAYHKP